MTFTPGSKVYVRYSTDIMNPVTECLTVSKYQNHLLYFKEKSSYYAVECHMGSFYGFSHSLAGKVIITKHKWQIPFATIAEKVGFKMPVQPQKATRETKEAAIKMQLSKVS